MNKKKNIIKSLAIIIATTTMLAGTQIASADPYGGYDNSTEQQKGKDQAKKNILESQQQEILKNLPEEIKNYDTSKSRFCKKDVNDEEMNRFVTAFALLQYPDKQAEAKDNKSFIASIRSDVMTGPNNPNCANPSKTLANKDANSNENKIWLTNWKLAAVETEYVLDSEKQLKEAGEKAANNKGTDGLPVPSSFDNNYVNSNSTGFTSSIKNGAVGASLPLKISNDKLSTEKGDDAVEKHIRPLSDKIMEEGSIYPGWDLQFLIDSPLKTKNKDEAIKIIDKLDADLGGEFGLVFASHNKKDNSSFPNPVLLSVAQGDLNDADWKEVKKNIDAREDSSIYYTDGIKDLNNDMKNTPLALSHVAFTAPQPFISKKKANEWLTSNNLPSLEDKYSKNYDAKNVKYADGFDVYGLGLAEQLNDKANKAGVPLRLEGLEGKKLNDSIRNVANKGLSHKNASLLATLYTYPTIAHTFSKPVKYTKKVGLMALDYVKPGLAVNQIGYNGIVGTAFLGKEGRAKYASLLKDAKARAAELKLNYRDTRAYTRYVMSEARTSLGFGISKPLQNVKAGFIEEVTAKYVADPANFKFMGMKTIYTKFSGTKGFAAAANESSELLLKNGIERAAVSGLSKIALGFGRALALMTTGPVGWIISAGLIALTLWQERDSIKELFNWVKEKTILATGGNPYKNPSNDDKMNADIAMSQKPAWGFVNSDPSNSRAGLLLSDQAFTQERMLEGVINMKKSK